jgi:hypothetical protein
MNVYPWIISRPIRRHRLPADKPVRPMSSCDTCGWEWRGERRSCPACLRHTDG